MSSIRSKHDAHDVRRSHAHVCIGTGWDGMYTCGMCSGLPIKMDMEVRTIHHARGDMHVHIRHVMACAYANTCHHGHMMISAEGCDARICCAHAHAHVTCHMRMHRIITHSGPCAATTMCRVHLSSDGHGASSTARVQRSSDMWGSSTCAHAHAHAAWPHVHAYVESSCMLVHRHIVSCVPCVVQKCVTGASYRRNRYVLCMLALTHVPHLSLAAASTLCAPLLML